MCTGPSGTIFSVDTNKPIADIKHLAVKAGFFLILTIKVHNLGHLFGWFYKSPGGIDTPEMKPPELVSTLTIPGYYLTQPLCCAGPLCES